MDASPLTPCPSPHEYMGRGGKGFCAGRDGSAEFCDAKDGSETESRSRGEAERWSHPVCLASEPIREIDREVDQRSNYLVSGVKGES
jgi:hypothetical protein